MKLYTLEGGKSSWNLLSRPLESGDPGGFVPELGARHLAVGRAGDKARGTAGGRTREETKSYPGHPVSPLPCKAVLRVCAPREVRMPWEPPGRRLCVRAGLAQTRFFQITLHRTLSSGSEECLGLECPRKEKQKQKRGASAGKLCLRRITWSARGSPVLPACPSRRKRPEASRGLFSLVFLLLS